MPPPCPTRLRARWIAAVLACGTSACAHAPMRDGEAAMRSMPLDLAQALLRRGATDEAITLLNELHRQRPDASDVLVLRGTAFRDRGWLEEARNDLAAAVRSDGASAEAHAGLGIALDLSGRGSDALEHHREAARLEPTNHAYAANIGFSQLIHGQTREAITTLEAALRLDPTSRRAHNNLGFALARVGDFHGAASHFERGGTAAQASGNLGVAYELAGKSARALETYLLGARLEPTPGPLRDHATRLSQAMGHATPPTATEADSPVTEVR